MDEMSAMSHGPHLVRAQVVVQNYVCFVYLQESCFVALRRESPAGSTLRRCCSFLTNNRVRSFRNAVAHGNWEYRPDFSGLVYWARKDSDRDQLPTMFEVSQLELDFWQSLARCTAYAATRHLCANRRRSARTRRCTRGMKGDSVSTARKAVPRATRDEVLREFNHACAICGTANPQIHHIDGDHSNNDPLDLLPLCPNCHLGDQHNPTRPLEPGRVLCFGVSRTRRFSLRSSNRSMPDSSFSMSPKSARPKPRRSNQEPLSSLTS